MIANYPASPRNSARLLVYDRKTDTITHTLFSELFKFLPDNLGVVLNNTKVVKARLFGKKESGGKVEILLNSPLPQNHFKVYIRGRVKPDTKILLDHDIIATVTALHDDGTRSVFFTCKDLILTPSELYDHIETIGHIPLPPYIKREDEALDSEEYQTVFAKYRGAVAAPTASLHFTDTMVEELQKRYDTQTLTLHVGAGTFKPVEVENIDDHVMHEERFLIPKNAKTLIDSKKPLLAVGTTVTRTVEYYARTKKSEGECDLFLHPFNPPIRVNHLLTNFHLPKSTLIMLVAGFLGLETTLKLYKEAVKEKYRFFSYGDAMLIV